MTLLINTATYYSMVGLVENEKLIRKKIWEAGLRQSEELLPIIDKIVGKNKIDGIIVVTGPGSYTGLRVGVATANALAFGWNCKAVGINRFEYWRDEKMNMENKNIAIVLDNISDLIYAELQVKNNGQNIERIVCTIDELANKIIVPCYVVQNLNDDKKKILEKKLGKKCLGFVERTDFDDNVLDNLIKFGLVSLQKVEADQIIKPFYLRPAHITKPKK